MKVLMFLVVFFGAFSALGAQQNLLAVGQGVVSPATTTNLILSNGFTTENPAGLAAQMGVRLTGEHDVSGEDNGSDGMGAELGIGNGQMGMALGYYKKDCDTCEDNVYGGFALTMGNWFGIGFSGQEELYSAGLLLFPKGSLRFGLNAILNDPDGDDNNITAFGVGLAYYATAWSFTLDASKRDYENTVTNDDAVMVTPGLKMAVSKIELSVSMDNYVNEPDDANNDDDLWLGLGIGQGEPFHLAIYHDFVGEWALALSVFF